MRITARQTCENRTITVDFQNEATYFQLLGDGKAFVECVLAFLLVESKNSCGFTHIVFQEPPEPFATLDGACTLWLLADGRKEEHVVLSLVIPLVMKMLHILCQRMPERRFSKENEPRETLLLDRAHPALRVGVQIRRSWRKWH